MNSKLQNITSIKRWNVWLALRISNDMRLSSNKPNGVEMAVMNMSSKWPAIWW